jgi:hypothetical protein
MKSKLHSELLKQLDSATGPVQAVVQFRHANDERSIPAADEIGSLVKSVFERAEKISGHAPQRTNVLRNVASAVVEADPSFVRALIDQPEVISAMPSEVSESMMIPPHGKRPA